MGVRLPVSWMLLVVTLLVAICLSSCSAGTRDRTRQKLQTRQGDSSAYSSTTVLNQNQTILNQYLQLQSQTQTKTTATQDTERTKTDLTLHFLNDFLPLLQSMQKSMGDLLTSTINSAPAPASATAPASTSNFNTNTNTRSYASAAASSSKTSSSSTNPKVADQYPYFFRNSTIFSSQSQSQSQTIMSDNELIAKYSLIYQRAENGLKESREKMVRILTRPGAARLAGPGPGPGPGPQQQLQQQQQQQQQNITAPKRPETLEDFNLDDFSLYERYNPMPKENSVLNQTKGMLSNLAVSTTSTASNTTTTADNYNGCGGVISSDNGAISYKYGSNLAGGSVPLLNEYEGCLWTISTLGVSGNFSSSLIVTLKDMLFRRYPDTYVAVGHFQYSVYDQVYSLKWHKFQSNLPEKIAIPAPVAFIHFVTSPQNPEAATNKGFHLEFEAVYSTAIKNYNKFTNIFLTGDGPNATFVQGRYGKNERNTIVIQPTLNPTAVGTGAGTGTGTKTGAGTKTGTGAGTGTVAQPGNSALYIKWLWLKGNTDSFDFDLDSLNVWTFDQSNLQWSRKEKLTGRENTDKMRPYAVKIKNPGPRNDPFLLTFKSGYNNIEGGYELFWKNE